MLVNTNEYELVRFKYDGVTSIIYRKESGSMTFTGESGAAYTAYSGNTEWKPKTKRSQIKKSSVIIRTIRERDGKNCFFCGKEVLQEDETKEHLVARVHGGPNHISNIFLAHKLCNVKADHLSAPEKIKIHDKARINE